jgi:lysylphosphatidylglycerol synthetase-like protein (DUF2156 family)
VAKSRSSKVSARKKARRSQRTRAALAADLAAARAATTKKASDLLALAGDKTKPYAERVRAFIAFGRMVGLSLGEELLKRMKSKGGGSVH